MPARTHSRDRVRPACSRDERPSEDAIATSNPAHPSPLACCYAIDEGYLLPTLLSASQLRDNLPTGTADVVVLCFGSPSAATSAAAAFCAASDVRFTLVPTAALDGHPAICARFFLPKLLGGTYREILYLDGDTQVAASLAPLLAAPLPTGRILAVPDPMTVMIARRDGPWPGRRAYFRTIGIADAVQDRYFNSGVMRARMSDWEAVSRECLDLCRRDGARLAFRDQDALNLVVGDRGLLASFRWNFPPFFLNFGAETAIRPRLYHFMSNPRPWHGAFAPWGRTWHAPYVALAARDPDLARTMPPLSAVKYGRYVIQQRVKRFREARTWGSPDVRARIAALEANAFV